MALPNHETPAIERPRVGNAPRVPPWALAALAALPLWSVLYAGAFGARTIGTTHGVQGVAVFRSAGCAGCHGPAGQGTDTVPALTRTDKTFPVFADHISWVTNGSANRRGQPYGAFNRTANGGMPAFGDHLTEAEIRAVVCYERVRLSKAAPPPECELPPGSPEQ